MKSFKKNIYSTVTEDIVPCLDCIPQNVIIGSQSWAKCNLDVDQYTDGTLIPNVSATLWATLSTGAWCYYNDDPANAKYGKLYNWYAAVGIHDAASLTNPALRKKIAPVGYKVPENADWTALSSTIGGSAQNVGTKLKEDGTCHWIAPNTGTNTSGFTAFGAGAGSQFGFVFNGERTYFWSTDEFVPNANSGGFGIFPTDIFGNTTALYTNLNPRQGLSIRLLVDPCADCVANDVTIGSQIWTGCNANVSTYRDGTIIPEVTDPTAWAGLTTGAWCWYNNDSANGPTYGKLYNWYAVNNTANGGLAPVGYHVPTDTEWSTLLTYLGGASVAGNELRQTGLCHWEPVNTSATNTTGFSALGAGVRFPAGGFNFLKQDCHFWSNTADTSTTAWRYYMIQTDVVQRFALNKNYGFSVRFIKD